MTPLPPSLLTTCRRGGRGPVRQPARVVPAAEVIEVDAIDPRWPGARPGGDDLVDGSSAIHLGVGRGGPPAALTQSKRHRNLEQIIGDMPNTWEGGHRRHHHGGCLYHDIMVMGVLAHWWSTVRRPDEPDGVPGEAGLGGSSNSPKRLVQRRAQLRVRVVGPPHLRRLTWPDSI